MIKIIFNNMLRIFFFGSQPKSMDSLPPYNQGDSPVPTSMQLRPPLPKSGPPPLLTVRPRPDLLPSRSMIRPPTVSLALPHRQEMYLHHQFILTLGRTITLFFQNTDMLSFWINTSEFFWRPKMYYFAVTEFTYRAST